MAKSNSIGSKKVGPIAAVKATYTKAEYEAIGRRLVKSIQAPQAPDPFREYLRRREEEGLQLSPDALKKLVSAVADMNLAFASIHHLAIMAGGGDEGWLAVGIENIAKVGCRKAEIVNALLGETVRFGNFSEDLDVPVIAAEVAK